MLILFLTTTSDRPEPEYALRCVVLSKKTHKKAVNERL